MFCTGFVYHDFSGFRGWGGLGFPKTEDPVGMLGASCAAGGFGCAAWHFPDNSE